MHAIETEGLSKTYENGVVGLKDLTLTVSKGKIFGFLGPNGAGKTTTVRLLNGTLSPTGGDSNVLGLHARHEQVRLRTATLAEQAQMYEHLSVLENLRFYARMYDLLPGDAEKRIGMLLESMGLGEKRELKLGSFSTGMKKRVYLIRTLLHNPEIIFLDEPTSGLDPDNSRQVVRLIKRLAEEHRTTIFMCTHNLPLAEEICDSFGFISRGRMIASGSKEELITSMGEENRVSVITDRGETEYTIEREEEINSLLTDLMKEGRYIREVRRKRPSLEEVYFHYVGENTDELE